MKRIVYTFLIIFCFSAVNAQIWKNFANKDSLYLPGWYPFVNHLYSDGNSIIAAGTFTNTDTFVVNGLVKWSYDRWIPMGNGISQTTVNAVNKLNHYYAGGNFSNINNQPKTMGIGRFNGSSWVAVQNSNGDDFGHVSRILKYNNRLIIAGTGFNAWDVHYENIVQFDGNSFYEMGSLDTFVADIEIYNDEIYALDGVARRLKKYDGNSWVNVGGLSSGNIICMTVDDFNTFLYVGGNFSYVDDTLHTDRVAIWNGFYWERFGTTSGSSNVVEQLEMYHGRLYAALVNFEMGGINTGRLAMYDWNDWQPVSPKVLWLVQDLEVHKDTLWVGGECYYQDSLNVGTIGRWYMPEDTSCDRLLPRAFVLEDTIVLWNGQAVAQFFNNNPYIDSWHWLFSDGTTSDDKDPSHIFTSPGTYNATLTVRWGTCVKIARTQVVVVESEQGINDKAGNIYHYKVSPNPTSGNISINCNLPVNVTGEVRIFNSSGALIKILKLNTGENNLSYDTGNTPSSIVLCGLYVNGRQIALEKIVKAN